jgi:hypothetical protein
MRPLERYRGGDPLRSPASRRWTVILIAIAVLAVASASALILSRSSPSAPQGRDLAEELLNRSPVPSGAVVTDSAIESLSGPPSIVGCAPSWDVHRTYVFSRPTSVDAFVRSHLPAGSKITGSGFSAGPGTPTVQLLTVTVTGGNGAAAPVILYSSVSPLRRLMDLRVDVETTLPTSRCGHH